jgi:hypothetical protein
MYRGVLYLMKLQKQCSSLLKPCGYMPAEQILIVQRRTGLVESSTFVYCWTLLVLSELYVDLKNGKSTFYEVKTQMVPLKVLDSHTEDGGNLYYSNSEVKYWKGISSDITAT